MNATIGTLTGASSILDDDPAPALSVNDISIGEGSTGAFTVSRANASVSGVTVNYILVASSAASGLDYTYTGGTLTVPA